MNHRHRLVATSIYVFVIDDERIADLVTPW